MNSMRAETLWRAALRRATSSAAAEMSVAMMCAPGNSCASAMAMQPEPVPTSAMRNCGVAALQRRHPSANAQAFEGDFDHVLGFGARNQHSRA